MIRPFFRPDVKCKKFMMGRKLISQFGTYLGPEWTQNAHNLYIMLLVLFPVGVGHKSRLIWYQFMLTDQSPGK